MKVFLSADIEGVCGIAHWDEARKSHADYPVFRDQMMKEVAAVCRGATAGGAREIFLKDAHATGRNLEHRHLPRHTFLVRGWAGHPMCMLQELDESFDAVMMVGYHSPAGSGGNPLAHTLSSKFYSAELCGQPASEFLLHAHAAAAFGVPVVLVSGDQNLGELVHEANPLIESVVTGKGVGHSVVARHPDQVMEDLEHASKRALEGDLSTRNLEIPSLYQLKLAYHDPKDAYRAGQYPGMQVVSDTCVVFETMNYLEIMRALLFVS